MWMLAAILCYGTMNVQAQEEQEFEVTEGDFNVVKQKGKTGSVTFDYDHARMGNLRTKTIDKETVVEYLQKNDEKSFRKWDDFKQEGKEMFIKRWNELLPEVPLYSNIYITVYPDWLQGYEQSSYWNFEQAILYASVAE